MNFGDLRSALDDLAGLDLESEDQDALLNEGHRELAIRSEWYRAGIDVGPTVIDQAEYPLPDDVVRILKLEVAGTPYFPSYREQVIARTETDIWDSNCTGLWYIGYSATNARQVVVYPAPAAAGSAVTSLVIERPALMDDDADLPVVPEEYHRAIVDYAASIAFGAQEDNPDLRAFYQESFDRKVGELRRLTLSQNGRSTLKWELVR